MLSAFGVPFSVSSGGETLSPVPSAFFDPCFDAPLRTYDVTAVRVPISYNNWGDFDPHGRMFVLDELRDEMLTQVTQSLGAAALPELAERLDAVREAFESGDPEEVLEAVQGFEAALLELLSDPGGEERGRIRPSPLVEPFTVRAHLGDCVLLRLSNALLEPVSITVSGVYSRPGMGMAFGNNVPDLTPPGGMGLYKVFIPDVPGMEGAHILQSGADTRFQVKHGLFGSLVAEPAGTAWLSPADGSALASGDEAMIVHPMASDFREHFHYYHDEAELFGHNLAALPIIDQFGVYGPGSKALNYRSEPFLDRFQAHDEAFEAGLLPTLHDKSQGYGSYTYGDPGTYIPRGYIGDPAKFRMVNVGPGQHHVHHLHGGGIRWRASPVADDTQFDDGFLKTNPVVRAPSERLDVQLIGPGESFNLEPEGGTGGVQQSAGDFLFHCHIAEHYVAGMWAFWRAYNTLQPDLAQLPDRAGETPGAVNSVGLLGTTLPDGTTLTTSNVDEWVKSFLPPPGRAKVGDASVWDWNVESTPDGPLYLGEPESTTPFPNYVSPTPGERPELLFNPINGKPAYPLLRPHFGHRPPFAPEHGPAPYLKPDVAPEVPDGLCPAGTRQIDYNLVAMTTPVHYNANDVNPTGQVYVHATDKAAVEAGTLQPKSMFVRANQFDCVDVLLTSQLAEKPAIDPETEQPTEVANGVVSKVNIHIHLVQFDVQGSDGVITGMNYETSVRSAPASRMTDTVLAPSVSSTTGAPSVGGGVTVIPVDDPGVFLDADGEAKVGSLVGIGLTTPAFEMAHLVSVDTAASTITVDAELANAHPTGALVGYEFVRYRWYADVELGLVYWHDHVDGLRSWLNGLFGGLIVEPKDSRWLDPNRAVADPASNPDQPSLHVADIVTPTSPGDKSRNYREVMLQFQDRGCLFPDDEELCTAATLFPLPPDGVVEPSAFNLRSAPFSGRNTATPLANAAVGLPATELVQAYPGDEVMFRLLYTGQSSSMGVSTFGLTGHRFALEQHLPGSRTIDTVSFGISSHHNLRLECGAGGCANLTGDYLYGATSPDHLRRGAWGVFRVLDPADGGLHPLPPNPSPAAGSLPSGPVRHYDVVAVAANVVLNQRAGLVAPLKVFALASEADAIQNGTLRPTPLVLRALPGERIEVTLENRLSEPVSLHASLVLSGPDDLGIPVGAGPDTRVPAGGTRTYTWYADRELGAAHLMSYANPAGHAAQGLYGALVVEPAGSTFSTGSGPVADVTLTDGTVVKELVVLYSSGDRQFESSTMPYAIDVSGLVMANYRSEPWASRTGRVAVHSCQQDPNGCGDGQDVRFEVRNPLNPLTMSTAIAAAETPSLTVASGQPFVIRAVGAAGDQLQVQRLSGHAWAADPDMPGCRTLTTTCKSNLVSGATLGQREVSNAWIPAAGPGGAGDYLLGTGRGAFVEAGAWGVLRVT